MNIAHNVESVRSHYTAAWGGIHSQIVEMIDSGERNIISIIYAIERKTNSSFDGPLSVSNAWIDTANIPRNGNGVPLLRIIAAFGYYVIAPTQMSDELLISTVCSYVDENTDYVVELGSGWGRNLFRVQAALKYRRLKARYAACELTENGRRCTELLWGLDREIPLDVLPFNYYEPDLSFLGKDKNVVFFTCCSIEQITHFNPKVFEVMLENTNECICVNSEPVGWQLDPELRHLASRNENDTELKKLRQEAKLSLYSRQNFPLNSFLYAKASGYNVDVIEHLNKYRDDGKINVDFILRDYLGLNAQNPLTLIVWRNLP